MHLKSSQQVPVRQQEIEKSSDIDEFDRKSLDSAFLPAIAGAVCSETCTRSSFSGTVSPSDKRVFYTDRVFLCPNETMSFRDSKSDLVLLNADNMDSCADYKMVPVLHPRTPRCWPF